MVALNVSKKNSMYIALLLDVFFFMSLYADIVVTQCTNECYKFILLYHFSAVIDFLLSYLFLFLFLLYISTFLHVLYRYFRSLNLPRTVMSIDLISPTLMRYNDTITTHKGMCLRHWFSYSWFSY